MIVQNKGYAPGLALGRRDVSKVSRWWLRGSLLYETLLLALFNYLHVLIFTRDHELHQRALYIHAMMMQHLVFWQQQLLK